MADETLLRMRHAEVVFLAGYLKQLMEWDAKACVRIQQRGSVAGFFGAPPTDCISFIAVPLSSAGELAAQVEDRTVSAGRMRDVLGDVSVAPRGFAGRQLKVPEPVSGPLELLDLPPTSGWELTEEALASAANPSIDAAVADFKSRVDPSAGLDEAAAQRVANEIWSRPGWSDLPIRILQTARLLGFLANDEAIIRSAQLTGWRRLSTGAGQVFSRNELANLSLPLTVLR